MERFKQTVVSLGEEVADLKRQLLTLRGTAPAKGDVHFATAAQEFGEYSLDELDTFRFYFVATTFGSPSVVHYTYRLTNPTPELAEYLRIQQKTFISSAIPVDPDEYEHCCMQQGGTPFVLTTELRRCLGDKLWEYAIDPQHIARTPPAVRSRFRTEFAACVVIPFKNTYKIPPHVAFYLTPFAVQGVKCAIKEITTKQVEFVLTYDSTLATGSLKLHYSISGPVETAATATVSC
jgi:hypothetical protein